jgi:nucleotide-binding universal stress UspA family protein
MYRPPQRTPPGSGLAVEIRHRVEVHAAGGFWMSVVVAYAPTPEGRAALARAGDECRLRDAGLVIVKSAANRLPDGVDLERYEAELEEACRKLEATGVRCEVRDVHGDAPPADDLLEAASQTSAEVIVIGLRRRTPVGKLLLGSNAQRILLDAECPVLAVKADAGA